MKETKLVAKKRTGKGSAEAGRLRRTGWFPAVIYGAGRPGVDIQMNEHDFVMVLRSHRSENMIVDLDVEGADKPVKVMVKAMQHHPVTGRVIHVDFYEVDMAQKIETEVAVKLLGEPVGVVNEGGMLEHIMRTVAVQCLPADVLDEVAVDISGLHVGQALRVQDVPLDTAKYKLLDDPEQVIVSIAASRTEQADASSEEAAKAPEVLTEKKQAEEK